MNRHNHAYHSADKANSPGCAVLVDKHDKSGDALSFCVKLTNKSGSSIVAFTQILLIFKCYFLLAISLLH